MTAFGTRPPLGAAIADESPRNHRQDLILAFATAIARPGGNALILDEGNNAVRWTSIEEAATSRLAFAVDVAADVLAIDCDQLELAPEVCRLADDLKIGGHHPVLVNSGRPAHLHLFCRFANLETLERYKARARAVQLDVRRTIRPPLAPHRLGLSVSLLSPDDPVDALRALMPAESKARRLTPRMEELLRIGDYTKSGYRSRSEAILALALASISTVRGKTNTAGP